LSLIGRSAADKVGQSQLLDLLLDINNSAQIPPERRFDLSLPATDPTFALDIDQDPSKTAPPKPSKALRGLLRDVPHIKYAAAGEAFGTQLQDLQAGRDSPADPSQGLPYPPTFLTADDIDNYIWDADRKVAAAAAGFERRNGNSGSANKRLSDPLPSLAPEAMAARNDVPAATLAANATRDAALRNPTSVYTWLRKHAPKTFLQDAEGGDKVKKEDGENGHSDERNSTPAGRTGRGKGERLSRGGSARTQRRAAARAVEDSLDFDDEMSLDVGTPEPSGASKGKRKRQVDDDPGYRPKGGSSRAPKRKRRSDADSVSTPTATTNRKLAPRKNSGAEGHSRRPSAKLAKKERDAELGDDVEDEVVMQDADDAELD
jgi:hypothetical protein